MAVTLVLLLLLRALLPLVPSMWAWSLNLHRFVSPWIGWGAWLLTLLALIPEVARKIVPWWERVGRAFELRPTLSTLVASLAGGALVLMFPDRLRFVGDFLLRQGTVEIADKPSLLFPQALPLDVLLHYSLPTYLTSSAWIDANGAARIVGALEAALLVALAISLARGLAVRGAGAVAVVAVVFFGGYLGMFTGFSKAFAEMCLVAGAVAVFGLRVVREGRGLLGLGMAVAFGVALHRSALGALPALAFAWITWFRTHGRGAAWRRPANLLGLAIPVVALAIMVPRIVAVVARWDAVHFVPGADRGGVLGAAIAGTRPADLLNIVLLVSPLAPLIPVLAASLGRGAYAGNAAKEAALLWLLALPFLVVMPLLHPVQGIVRDWDDFAATGVAISVLVAWYLAQALRGAGKAGWIAVGITMSALAPTVAWLAHNADLERGLLRVRALMLEPPARDKAERGNTWDFLGIRYFRLQRFDEASQAFARAAETSPSPRILQEWALAETMRGQYREAQRIYYLMLAKSPENLLGWLGLSTVSFRAGDMREASRAAGEILRLQPGNRDAQRVLNEIAKRGAAGDTSAPAAPPPGAGPP